MNNARNQNRNQNRNNANRRTPNTNNGSAGSRLVQLLLGLQTDIKMFHWQTRSYAVHVETGKLFDSIIALTDTFIEQYMGTYGRPRMAASASVPLRNMTKAALVAALKSAMTQLASVVPTDTHLQNLKDEINGELAKALFLLTLN